MWELIDHLAKEWAVIKEAPIAAALCFLAGVLLAWLVAKHHFAERIAVLADRIALLDRTIEDYRERLGLVPPDRTAYSKLTNMELRREVGDFLSNLRAFGVSIKDESYRQTMSQHQQMIEVTSDDARKQLWDRQNAQYSEMSIRHKRDYDHNFKTKAIILRDELLKRLPTQQRSPMVDTSYTYLVGPNPVGEVASDLERLSALLPQR